MMVQGYDGSQFQPVGSDGFDGSVFQDVPVNGYDGSNWARLDGAALPDSAVHRWPAGEGSGSTAADAIGSADISINGLSWVSGDWIEGYALEGDGTDDYGVIGTDADTWIDSLTSGVSMSVTIEATGAGEVMGFVSSDGDNLIMISTRSNWGGDAGAFTFSYRDGDRNTYAVETAQSNFNDGTRRRVHVKIPDNQASNCTMYVNGSEVSTEVITDDSPTDPSRDTDFTTHALSGDQNYLEGVLDDPLLYTGTLTESDIQSDYNRQPWS